MSLIKILLGYRDFATLQDLRRAISKNEANSIEKVNEMLLFETKLQKTWLICTNNALYCALDDIRKNSSDIRWKLSKTEIIRQNEIKISLNIRDDQHKPEKYGRVDFGNYHKNWLYSKSLFTRPEKLRSMFQELIRVSMLS